MAATGYTPIYLYYSSTATNQPSAGNLGYGELAINITDKNLFFKDNANTVNTVPLRQASGSSNGWLSSTDWTTFNSKQPAGTYVTSVTGTAPVVSSGGTTPAISMAAATGSVNGYLTSTDWTTFNGKQAALVSGTNIKTVSGTSLLGSGDVGTIGTGYGGTGLTTFTANRIFYASSSSAIGQSANLTFDGTTFTTGADAVINTVNVGQGNSAVAGNTVLGYHAGTAITSGQVTAIGYEALKSNTTGSGNLAVGMRALQANVGGTGNTALGNYYPGNYQPPLYSNTSGSANTGISPGTLTSNTTGANNTAIGYACLFTNVSGSNNTCIGYNALYLNTASFNTAIGMAAGYTNSSGQITAVGYQALYNNTTGLGNVAVGGYEGVATGTSPALFSNTTGTFNVGIGYGAGKSNQTNNNITAVGTFALQSSVADNNTGLGVSAGQNITSGANNLCLGVSSGADAVQNITTGSNIIVAGNNSHTNAYIKISWTVTSDARDKTEFDKVPHGLNFVTSLTPCSYRYKENRETDVGVGPVRYGFKAQDILALEGKNPVIIDSSDEENLKYNEQSMIAVLVNAIKELKTELDELKAKVN